MLEQLILVSCSIINYLSARFIQTLLIALDMLYNNTIQLIAILRWVVFVMFLNVFVYSVALLFPVYATSPVIVCVTVIFCYSTTKGVLSEHTERRATPGCAVAGKAKSTPCIVLS